MSLFSNKKGDASSEVLASIKNGDIILDVRSEEEFEEGHIENSINIPLQSLPDRIEEIKEFNKAIVAVCRSGNRSDTAAKFLRKQDISVLNGGGWDELNTLLTSS